MDSSITLAELLDGRAIILRMGFDENLEEGEIDLYSHTERLDEDEGALLVHLGKGLIHLLQTQPDLVEQAGDDYYQVLEDVDPNSNVVDLFNIKAKGNA